MVGDGPKRASAKLDLHALAHVGVVDLVHRLAHVARDEIAIITQVDVLLTTEVEIAVVVALLHDHQAHHARVTRVRTFGHRHVHRSGKIIQAHQR